MKTEALEANHKGESGKSKARLRHYKMYIGGRFIDAKSGKTRTIINPATGESYAIIPDAQSEDVDAAVKAARKAFDEGEWRKVNAQQRGKMLMKVAQKIFERQEEFTKLEIENNGKPKREAEGDVIDAANCFEFYAGLCNKIHGETMSVPANSFSYVIREPIGVCAQITPWNYPLLMGVWKLAPALAAGNCVILKPSELTPISCLELAKIFDEVGFPAGVVNIISGDGPVAGDALTRHPLIDKIAFTGGTTTGRKIMQAASVNLKKITLELGGKNPAIFFDDCDLDLAADWGAFASFANQGQVCSAGSRLLIQEGVYDELVKRIVEKTKKIKIGNGMDEGVTMGPLISEAHRNKVENYIKIAKDEGAKMILGGDRPSDPALQKGWFLNPTIFVDVVPSMRNASEEIFGPVMSIIKFKTEEEGVAIANNTEYGLAGGIFTQDVTRVHRVTREMRCGIVWVNYYHPTFNEMPWGGYKHSGTGRELGLYGIEGYLETKQININLDTKPENWYS